MIESAFTQLLNGGWILAASRVLFVGLIYLFLFQLLRTTARELAAIARTMPSSEGQSSQASLVVEEGGESSLRRGQAVSLPAAAIVGREAGSDILADDPHVSARHAQLRYERGRWWLRDLGSSNGTLLNGELVRTVVAVHHGDVLQCGRVRFRFVSSIAVPFENASA
jgi:pSer/pThr/pTyr-binding forkhead associated (FHA) protein